MTRAPHGPLTKLMCGVANRISAHVEDEEQRRKSREVAAEADRDRQWAEALERRKRLSRRILDEEAAEPPLHEAAGQQAVFVAHSQGARRALERLAGEGARLTLAREARQYNRFGEGADATGSWLVFEHPPADGDSVEGPVRTEADPCRGRYLQSVKEK